MGSNPATLSFLSIIVILSGLMIGNQSPDIKYLAVFLCLIYSIYGTYKRGAASIRALLIPSALFLAFMADYYLLYTRQGGAGIILFILVQSCYFLYIHPVKRILPVMAYLLLLSLAAERFFISPAGPVIILSIVYGTMSVFNIAGYIGTFIYRQNIPGKKLLLAGILLLFFCDIHVALWNLNSYISFDNNFFETWSGISGSIIWLLYLPSVVCVALSSNPPDMPKV
ncbi:hypothetical protein [Parasporobacterium paucivorans]|uniref:YhhN-like protein n=1 Tax=Parasporobacterium paucivorans DSM 15970 TaxID=1122934 RepID=A0A1M6FML7_9FIRM|nr:hypothetical protein [Parasporobacterium paucivorans]SHI98893.1 hypothetical protein SAMN02745691_01149 [Parasporobacterium paucivorans DSM 15970]